MASIDTRVWPSSVTSWPASTASAQTLESNESRSTRCIMPPVSRLVARSRPSRIMPCIAPRSATSLSRRLFVRDLFQTQPQPRKRRLQIVCDRSQHLGSLLDVAANARLHHVEGHRRVAHFGRTAFGQWRLIDVAAERGRRPREAVERTCRHARDDVREQHQAKRKHDRVQQPSRRARSRPVEVGLRAQDQPQRRAVAQRQRDDLARGDAGRADAPSSPACAAQSARVPAVAVTLRSFPSSSISASVSSTSILLLGRAGCSELRGHPSAQRRRQRRTNFGRHRFQRAHQLLDAIGRMRRAHLRERPPPLAIGESCREQCGRHDTADEDEKHATLHRRDESLSWRPSRP